MRHLFKRTDGWYDFTMRSEFIYTELFEKTAAGLLTDPIMEDVENTLCINPRAGDVMRNTNGVRKLRVALPGRGKRGSARVTYLYVEVGGHDLLPARIRKKQTRERHGCANNVARGVGGTLEGGVMMLSTTATLPAQEPISAVRT